MALSKLTKVQTLGIGSNIEVVGVITTGQFKSGTSNLHSTGVELTNLNVSGIATIGGSISIGGTLTYQDVTNVDSVGIITARDHVKLVTNNKKITFGSGSNLEIYSTGTDGVVNAASGDIKIQKGGSGLLTFKSTGSHFLADVLIADSIIHDGDTDTKIRFPAANTVTVEAGGHERIRIASSKILKGLTSARGNYGNNTSGVEYGVQIEGTTAITSSMSLVRNSDDANDGGIVLGKTRATSTGGNTVVQAGDDLGNLTFAGNDGTTMLFGAEIFAEVQSGVGNDDMPADLIFKTNGGSTSTTERLRIASGGELIFAGDTDTFIDHPNANQIEITAGNIEVATFIDGQSNRPAMLIDKGGVNNTTGGANYNSNGNSNDLVIGNVSSGNHGMTICTPSSGTGTINFSDGSGGGADAYRGSLSFEHANELTVVRAKSGKVVLRNDATDTLVATGGKIGIGIDNPNGILAVSDGTVTGEINPYNAGGVCYIGTRSNHGVILKCNAQEKIKIDTDGDTHFTGQRHRFNFTNSGGVGPFLSLRNTGTATGSITGICFGIGGSSADLDGSDYGEGQIKVYNDSGGFGNMEFNLHVNANRSFLKIVGNGQNNGGAGAGTEGMRGGVAFGNAGIAIDRSWTGQPGIHVFNQNVEGDTDQGTFRFHGWNRSYASYPDASGNDFSVSLVADGMTLTSDKRRKTDITTITGALNTVSQMRGVSFTYVNRDLERQTHMSMKNGKKLGFIAQEVIPLLPELILDSGEKAVELENGYCDRYNMDYGGVTPLLVEAIKELKAKNEALEARVAALEGS